MARTNVETLTLTDTGNKGIGVIGKATLNLTAVDSTTATLYVGGRCLGRIRNRTAGTLTITFYELEDVDGEPYVGSGLRAYEEDGSVIAAVAIPAKASIAWPSGLAGCEWVLMKLSSGTGEVGVVIHR